MNEQKSLATKNLGNCSKAFNEEFVKNVGYLQALEQTVQTTVTQNAAREELFQHKSDLMESNFYTDRNSQDETIRSLFLVHRLWSFILKKRIQKEIKDTKHLEEAYRRMVADTGINDMKEIVNRFINREDNYKQIISEINFTEEKIDQKMNECDQLRKALLQKELNSQASKNDQEILQLQNKIEELKKSVHDMKQKKNYAVNVYDQTSDWVGVKSNMSEIPTGKNLQRGKLNEFFESFKIQVESQIQRIKESQEPVNDLINKNAKKHVKQMAKKENMRVQLETSEFEKKQLAVLIGQTLTPEGAPPPGGAIQTPNVTQERIRIKAEQRDRENQLREEWRKQQKETEQKQQEERKKMLKKMGVDTNK